MKKYFISTIMMLLTVAAMTQNKISPLLQNGYRAVYIEEQTSGETKIVAEYEYVVSDVTPNGAIITTTLLNVETTGGEDDLTGKLMAMGEQIMRGVSVKLIVNADGQVTGLQNTDEVKARCTEMANTMIDELLAQAPQIAQMMPKEALLAQVTEKLDEQSLIQSLTNIGVLSLNGKTPMNGASETFSYQGMKMKRMYFVAGKRIITNSTLDMTTDELKEFIIHQVEQIAPDQAEMIRQNIDLIMGQMTMEMTIRSTYELQDNGWVKSIQTETTENMMGQSSRQVSTTTLKE
jgi:hypothetical protein